MRRHQAADAIGAAGGTEAFVGDGVERRRNRAAARVAGGTVGRVAAFTLFGAGDPVTTRSSLHPVQPSHASALPSSHSSPGQTIPSPQTLTAQVGQAAQPPALSQLSPGHKTWSPHASSWQACSRRMQCRCRRRTPRPGRRCRRRSARPDTRPSNRRNRPHCRRRIARRARRGRCRRSGAAGSHAVRRRCGRR